MGCRQLPTARFPLEDTIAMPIGNIVIKLVTPGLFLAISVIGCNSGSMPQTGNPYPINPYPIDKPVSTPPSILSFPSVIPTPFETKGTIVGQLKGKIPGTSPEGLVLYLGTLLPLTPGPDYLINLDTKNAPSTQLHADGKFIFSNIAPGQYVLILWTPRDSLFVADPNDPVRELIVSIEPGKITNIGDQTISLPR
jgi:hypothetical protein